MKKMHKKRPLKLAPLIDHTFLKGAGTRQALAQLFREARQLGCASVCVNPCEVRHAAKALAGSDVRVCTVIGFPLGQNTTRIKCLEAEEALRNGADELDFVVNQRLLKYAPRACARELAALVAAARATRRDAVLKLILECCALTPGEIERGAKMAVAAGFDFVKTSTGFGAGGATVEDVRLLRRTVGNKAGVKAAGGVRDRAAAEALVRAGATRLGSSAAMVLCFGENE